MNELSVLACYPYPDSIYTKKESVELQYMILGQSNKGQNEKKS